MSQPPDFSSLPDEVRGLVQRQWEEWAADPTGWPESVLASLPRVWACSRFVAQVCLRDPALAQGLVTSADLERSYATGEFAARLADLALSQVDEAGMMASLRRFRTREMVRIAWRDLADWAPLGETLRELSDLADACVDAALRWHDARLSVRHGAAHQGGAGASGLAVLAMGKLGGRELNFSSDIDLIFVFAEPGETDGAQPVDYADYYRRLARAVVRTLDEPTDVGIVFRVDTRLRPFGDSGPLVMHAQAMEDYYQYHGREWERYALIKARPCAGDRLLGEEILRRLQPFVYRRYLDFNAFESLRSMKRLIERQVAQKGLQDNIKLGPGGIREIEFIVQAFQLVRGGPEPELQGRALLSVLDKLGRQSLLTEQASAELRDAYCFLRRVENRLQAWADQQTHELPSTSGAREVLALAMNCNGWSALSQALQRTRRRVHEHFEAVFAAPHAEGEADDPFMRDAVSLWNAELESDAAHSFLGEMGVRDPAPVLDAIQGLGRYAERSMGAGARRRLDQLMPLLLGAAREADDPGTVVVRVIEILEAIAGRATYIALLVENPMALSQLVRLCAASPWITHQLARHPVLLDDLLDPRTLHTPPRRAELERGLAERMARVEAGDLEAEMDALRHFKQANALRVAAADISEAVPLMVVSDHLTELAEVLLAEALRMAWDHMSARYGRPVVASEGRTAGFAIVAYGKLGGLELGYSSDLDLVFLHDSPPDQLTTGPKAVDHHVFFVRLGQRIIHILSTQTAAGQLYEVDMRLRPSGQAGLLVSGLEAFERYQWREAWTWEHQALVRARPVAGDDALSARFAKLRHEVLSQSRDAQALRQSVLEMRGRMRENLETRAPGRFDIKQGRGGLTDIEFIVQYAVLRFAAKRPELTRYTDNIRILESLRQAGFASARAERTLADAYRAYRARLHRLALMEAPRFSADEDLRPEREAVSALWEAFVEGGGDLQ